MMNKNFKKIEIKDLSYHILRIGLSLVILWFGMNQLINPDYWIGYVPSFLFDFAGPFIIFNGIFEVVFGFLLMFNLYPRFVSLILAIHMFIIIIDLGYNEIAIRDFGIFVGFVALFFYEKKD